MKQYKVEPATVEETKKLLRNLNTKKNIFPDKVPPNFFKMSANTTESYPGVENLLHRAQFFAHAI